MELSMTINTPYGYCGIVSGRNILMSSNQGNLKPEQVEELTRNLLKLSFNFRGQPFAYIADPTKLNPIISIETSMVFAIKIIMYREGPLKLSKKSIKHLLSVYYI